MIWLLPMTVLVFAYTGTLTASLMAPKLEPIVSNLGELAASSKFRLTVEKSLLMADIIFVIGLNFYFLEGVSYIG